MRCLQHSLDLQEHDQFCERLREVPRISAQNLAANRVGGGALGQKTQVVSYQTQGEDDERHRRDKQDFTGFDRKHDGSATTILLPPTCGWDGSGAAGKS